MTTQTEVRKMVAENKAEIENNLNEIWRKQAEDLIGGGISAQEVAGSMLSVACVQVMLVKGASETSAALQRMADKLAFAAEHGCEFPAQEPATH